MSITIRDIFDTVNNHLVVQYKRSLMEEHNTLSRCAYRGHDGLKCAIGCLIADEHYDKSLEGLAGTHPSVRAALSKSLNIGVDELATPKAERMLAELQLIHDYSLPDLWIGKLAELRKELFSEGKE